MDAFDVTICVVVGFILGVLICDYIIKANYRTDAIERGYALYCPDDGKFAWVGECDE